MPSSPLEIFFRRLAERDDITPEERVAIERTAAPPVTLPPRTDIVHEGDSPRKSTLLLSGFATRYSLLPNGRRQITAIHIAGDFVDLHSLPLEVMDHAVGTLSECTLCTFDHRELMQLVQRFPHLMMIFWKLTLLDGAMHREWIVAFGAMPALAHLAHLICELYVRLKVIGLTRGAQFDFPITQDELADTLGLSIVHVNRTLQEMRAEGLISFDGRSVTILDWRRLLAVGKFDPKHLHLRKHGNPEDLLPS